MLMVALGEILVVFLVRPIRFIFAGDKTPVGRAIHRFESWLLHHLHVINAESRMRYELELQGKATAFLTSNVTDGSGVIQSTSETADRARRVSGADHGEAMRSAERFGERDLSRGQRHVETRGGERSEDIHEAMLRAQRRQNQQAERERRRQSRRS